MRPASRACAIFCVAVWSFAVQAAQQPAPAPKFDPAVVSRGEQLLKAECAFCHGANARGGSGGPDLTRSALVQTDENGKQLGAFLRAGREDKGMPKFDLAEAQVSDLATFLHNAIYLASNRGLYKILDILVGDPKAGESFFNGTGNCRSCHSPTGDLKGIGARYEAVALQGRFLLPRSGGAPGTPAYRFPNALKVTVTPASGEPATGTLARLTDFEVTLYDAPTGQMRTFLRNGDAPKVVVTDPLQAHVDMLKKWTDTDMHNVTAYLASLK